MDFIFDPTLVLYLPLWKRDNAVFQSDDAYGHLCTVTGATWGLQGRTFDGIDDKIAIPDNAALNPTVAVTLEAWVSFSALTVAQFPFSSGQWPDGGYFVRLDGAAPNTKIYWSVPAVADLAGTKTDWATSTWYHWVCLFDSAGGANNAKIYVNDVLDAQGTFTGAMTAFPFTKLVGCGAASTGFFKGIMGEIRVYSRALTEVERQRNYLATKWRYR